MAAGGCGAAPCQKVASGMGKGGNGWRWRHGLFSFFGWGKELGQAAVKWREAGLGMGGIK